jgi:hypothetical protein
LELLFHKYKKKYFSNGDWGLGIGDWGLGIGPNPQNPQTPNPKPPNPKKKKKI